MNKWKRKAKALARLAEDQRGKPEGDLAREKLLEIINNHPEAINYEPVAQLLERDIKLSDVLKLKYSQYGIAGEWQGTSLAEAIYNMLLDYQERLGKLERKKLK